MPKNLPKSPYIYVGLVKQKDLQLFIDVNKNARNRDYTNVKRLPFRITIDNLFSVIEEHYGISKEDLKSKKRQERITYARQLFTYWLREYYGSAIPWKRIGIELSKDYSNIIYYNKKFRDMLLNNQLIPKSFNRPGTTIQSDYTVINNKIYSLC